LRKNCISAQVLLSVFAVEYQAKAYGAIVKTHAEMLKFVYNVDCKLEQLPEHFHLFQSNVVSSLSSTTSL